MTANHNKTYPAVYLLKQTALMKPNNKHKFGMESYNGEVQIIRDTLVLWEGPNYTWLFKVTYSNTLATSIVTFVDVELLI